MNNLFRFFLMVWFCCVLAFLTQPLSGQDCGANFGSLAEAAVCLSDDQAVISSSVLEGSGEHIPEDFERLFVLTSGVDLIIEAVNTTPEFLVTTDADYLIHSLIYDPATLDLNVVVFGETSAVVVNSLLLQGGGDICAALDVTGVLFRFNGCSNSCLADAGTLVPANDFACLPGHPVLQAEIQDDPIVPPGFFVIYVLTSTNSLIIEGVSATPDFTVQEAGDYRIHTLVFDPSSLDLSIVEFGVTTGFDVNGLLQQGGGEICAALDVTGAAFHVEDCEEECEAAFSTLLPLGFDCLDNNGSVLLRTFVIGLPTIPAGFEVLYVLTSGEELVIEAVNNLPAFTVEEAGIYTIHTLIYDPETLDLGIVEFGVTTGFDVNGLLLQGGGDICAVLDVEGASFNVENCAGECEADFGHIYASSHECLDGSTDLAATVFISPTIPEGFELLYVLTSGEELIIESVNDSPEFTVEEAGFFTIHTLVYDPETLDLGIVQFGVTTGFDVNGLLLQGGGEICAVLDVAGAAFSVENCEGECEAAFSTLIPLGFDCLDDNGSVLLRTLVLGLPTVPAGFEVLYVLTSGEELVIEAVNNFPAFTVEEAGRYTIHTLVYDPETLDLGIVEFGVTTGFDVNGLLLQGGGEICAVLDVEGAAFNVENCGGECEADFGHIFASSHGCLDGSIDLEATVLIPPTIPGGYELLYVLTSGSELIIESVSELPAFTVEETGVFTIHTLVYDPETLDLGIVEFGVTTGFDVNGLLLQGGGDICAALDVAGAAFSIEVCNNSPGAGVLFPNPVQGILQIQTPEIYLEQGMRISVRNTNGQVIKKILIEEPRFLESIDMSDMPAGTYRIFMEGMRSGYQTAQILKF